MSYNLIHGDCYDIIPTLKDKSIDLIITDPPYDFKNHGGGSLYKKGTKRMETLNKLNDLDCWEFRPKQFLDLIEPKLKDFYGYFFCNKMIVDEYITWAKERNYKFDILTMIKCLSGSTEVWCKNANNELFKSTLKDLAKHTNIKKVQVFNGEKWIYVNAVTRTKRDKGITLKLYNGNYICCTPEHRFFINNKEIEAKDLKEGMILDGGKIDYQEKETPFISETLAWFIGYFIANGSYSGKEIQIATNKEKEFVYQKIEKVCREYNAKFHVYNKPDSKARIIFVCSSILKGALEEYVSGELAYGKHLSKKAFNTNKTFLRNVLIGYLDGDGCTNGNGCYSIGFTRKNVNLKNDLISICNILGYHSTIKKSTSSYNGSRYGTWSGRIYFREINTRKINSDFEITEIIHENREYDFYDLSVCDKSHRFMLTDGTITHNCNPVPAFNGHHLNDIEYIVLIRKSGTYFNTKSQFDDYRKWYQVTCKKRIHPAEKPVELLERFVRVSCPEGGLIFDPFAGSGSTGIACLGERREFLGCEKNDEYYELASKRLKERDDELNGVGSLFEGLI